MRFPNDFIIIGVLAAISIVVLAQVILPERDPLPPSDPSIPSVSATPCRGEPINVDFAYTGTIHDQWTCRKQCDDQKLRYILYLNGMAAQCEELPGCNDYGEDNNITCIPSLKTNILPKS